MKKVLSFLETGRLDVRGLDWYRFLGFCDFHRIAGYLADKMPEGIPPQVRRHLDIQRKYQAYRQKLLSRAAAEIEDALQTERVRHAFLKGTALNGTLYRPGERGSNDVDILISPQDVGRAGKLLLELGYAQGLYRNGAIARFSRQEVISRRMNRGETAPYLKLTGDETVPFIEIDLNFSLDWLPASNASAVDDFLDHTTALPGGLTGLTEEYCLAFLCAHLYKEATVLSMVKRCKDIELYKYLDIFKLFSQIDRQEFFGLVRRLCMEKECNYALYHAEALFPSLDIGLPKPSDTDLVIDAERSDKQYVWDAGFFERLDNTDRYIFLREARVQQGKQDEAKTRGNHG